MNQAENNQKKLFIIPKCNINFFKLKQKAVISSGICDLYQTNSAIKLKTEQISLQVKLKSRIIKFKQINYLTFLVIKQQGGVFTVSIPAADETSQGQFETLMNQHAQVIDFFTLPAQSETRRKICFQTPINQLKGAQLGANNSDTLQTIGKGIGSVFGGISSIFNMDKYNKQVDETMTKFSKDTFGEQTVSGWQRFKNKCSQINEAMAEVIKPVSQKCKQVVQDIGQNFESSDNSIIKNVRQYSKKTEQAMNSGYETADAPRRVNFSLQNQSNQRNSTMPASQAGKSGSPNQSKKLDTKNINLQKTHELKNSQPSQKKVERTVSFEINRQSQSNKQKQANLLEQPVDQPSNERKSLL